MSDSELTQPFGSRLIVIVKGYTFGKPTSLWIKLKMHFFNALKWSKR